MESHTDESAFPNELYPDGDRPEGFDDQEREAIRRASARAPGRSDLRDAYDAFADEVKNELEAVKGRLPPDYFRRRPPIRTVVYVEVSPGIELFWVKAY